MSLSGLMNAVVEYVGDRLVNDIGRPVPDRMLRYHGPLPHDCCTDDGMLSVHWTDARTTAVGVGSTANEANNPCVQRPMVTLVVRYVICWPEPDIVEGVPRIDDAYDAAVNEKAGMLADVQDGITRALAALGCGEPVDQFVDAIWRNIAGTSLRFVDASPILPGGGCAGVLWRVHVAPLPGPVS